jgi:hypothetical protein
MSKKSDEASFDIPTRSSRVLFEYLYNANAIIPNDTYDTEYPTAGAAAIAAALIIYEIR